MDAAYFAEPAVASRPDLAVLLALWPLGPAMARRLAARAALGLEGPLQKGRGGPVRPDHAYVWDALSHVISKVGVNRSRTCWSFSMERTSGWSSPSAPTYRV